MLKTTKISLIILMNFFLALPVLAATDNSIDKPLATVNTDIGYVFPAEVEDRSTDIQIMRTNLGINYASVLSFGYALRAYQWDNPSNLSQITNDEDPFDQLHALSFGLQYYNKFAADSRWQYFIRSGITSAFEKEMNDSLQYNLIGALGYSITEQWDVGLGVGFLVNEIEPLIFPVARLTYQSQSVKAEGRGLTAVFGFPQTAVSYALSPKLIIKGYLDSDGGTYRLADDNPLAPEGYARTLDLIVGAKTLFGLTEDWRASVGVEYNLARDISIFDSGGSKLFVYDVDNATGFMASLTYQF